MAGGGSKPGERRGGRPKGGLNKRTRELAEAANNALVNAASAPLPEVVVLRKLGKERLIEIDELAMALVYKYREAAEKGDVIAEALLWKYLGLAAEAAARRAPYESPRIAAVPPREQTDDDRTITGESARERLLQTVLAVIAAEDAEAAARAEDTPADDPDKDLPTADDVRGILKPEPPEEDSGDGEAA